MLDGAALHAEAAVCLAAYRSAPVPGVSYMSRQLAFGTLMQIFTLCAAEGSAQASGVSNVKREWHVWLVYLAETVVYLAMQPKETRDVMQAAAEERAAVRAKEGLGHNLRSPRAMLRTWLRQWCIGAFS